MHVENADQVTQIQIDYGMELQTFIESVGAVPLSLSQTLTIPPSTEHVASLNQQADFDFPWMQHGVQMNDGVLDYIISSTLATRDSGDGYRDPYGEIFESLAVRSDVDIDIEMFSDDGDEFFQEDEGQYRNDEDLFFS